MAQHAVDKIIIKNFVKENLSMKNVTHKNIDGEVYEDELYKLVILSLERNKLFTRAFKR